jgi:hypothetical protein
MLEMTVERKNIAGAKLVGHRDQAGVGKVARRIGVSAYLSI